MGAFLPLYVYQQVLEKHLVCRLLKNGQMQGTRNSEV